MAKLPISGSRALAALVLEHLRHVAGRGLKGLEEALYRLLLVDEEIVLQVLLEFGLVLVESGGVVLIAVYQQVRQAVQVRVVLG